MCYWPKLTVVALLLTCGQCITVCLSENQTQTEMLLHSTLIMLMFVCMYLEELGLCVCCREACARLRALHNG